jgi:hypothetical protein
MTDFLEQGKKEAAVVLASGGSPQHVQIGSYDARIEYNNGIDAALRDQVAKRQKNGE